MGKKAYENLFMEAVRALRSFAPKRTGNLAFNAIKYRWISKNEFEIYVNQDIAPYMVFTNEIWLSPYWKGKKNPNQGWFDIAVKFISNYIAINLGGEVKK